MTSNTVAIRKATSDDVPRIVALLNAAFAMERAFIDRDRTSLEEIAQYLGTGTFFVVDGEPGALASCMYLEQRGDRVYLGMLAVGPTQQGRGLGTQMMAAAEAHALSLGCRAIDIRIVNRRTELPPFYRRLGFVDTGTEPFDDPLLTKPCHFLQMAKAIS
jgi:N-acetylglutamate synthase-like GNAT family acetyltransferase